MDMYREIILDHYKHPRNFGHLKNPESTTTDGNVTCGDRIVMEVNTRKEKDGSRHIVEIMFSGEGCAISQASASMLTEMVQGKSVSDVLSVGTEEILSMLGTQLTPSRMKCAMLPLEVLHKTVLALKK